MRESYGSMRESYKHERELTIDEEESYKHERELSMRDRAKRETET